MKMNRKVRMIIGIVALVIIIAIIVIIAVNGGKSNRGNNDPEPRATQSVTPSALPSDNVADPTPSAEPQESANPATDGNLGEEVPVTDTNLPSQELINELIEEYQKQNEEKE